MQNDKEKSLFQDLPTEQRAKALIDNALRVEEQLVTRDFTPQQIAQFKDELADDSVLLSIKKAEFEKVKKAHEADIKPIVEKITSTTKNLRLKYSENLEEVVLMDDQHEGVMNTYDMEGHLISTRRLYPGEKQLSIAHSSTGTHGE